MKKKTSNPEVMETIKALLEKSGMTKTEFAHEMGVVRETVSRWLSNRINMTLFNYQKAIKILSSK